MKLLKQQGYTVTKVRPDPRIGDVVRFHGEGPYDVLITFHELGRNEDAYEYGGVVVSEQKYIDQCSEALWIDRNEWAKDDGQYEVIGHVDLTQWIKR